MRNIKKVLIHRKSGKKFFIKDLDDHFHTQFGVVDTKELKSNKEIVLSNKKEQFLALKPTFVDLLEEFKRGPQAVIAKDIGLILAKTGVNKNSNVVDAGGGSGFLCFSLANICKEVSVYEINPEHHSILEKNKQMLGMKNITLKQADIYKGIKEKNLDLITLDLPEPWQVTLNAEKALLPGGHLVVYLPNLNQVKMFIDSCKRTSIKVLETIELLERKWKIEDRLMRPEHEMLGHTAFLIFCRKL